MRRLVFLGIVSVLLPPYFSAKIDEQDVFNTADIIGQVTKIIEATPPPIGNKKVGRQPYQHGVNKKVPTSTLKGKTLRIVVPAIEPPYVNYVNFSDAAPKDYGYGPGVVMEILKEMAELLNLTYDVVSEGTQQWGSLENGSWSGGFGELYRGNVDLIAGAAIMQYDRSLISDLTYPFQYEMTGMLVRSPEKFEDRTMLIVTAPFQWQVWVTTAGCIIVSAGVLLLISRLVGTVSSELNYGYAECIWIFYSIFVQQGLCNQPKSWSCRVLIALWWLASVTLMATFTGSLVALFAVEKIALPFQNIEGLAKVVKQGKFRILMDGNSRTRTEMIARSDLPVYKQLWHDMSVNHRVLYVDGMDKAIEVLHNQSGYVLLGPMETLSYYAYIDCHLYLLGEGILPVYLSIPLQLKSPYSNFFSDRIRGMDERGFIKKWLADYDNWVHSKKWEACNSTSNKPNSGYLDLKRAQGAFWILLGGLGFAAVLLLLEYGLRWSLQTIDFHRWFPGYFHKDHQSDTSPSQESTSQQSISEEPMQFLNLYRNVSFEGLSQFEQVSMISIRKRSSQRSKLEQQSSGEDYIEIDI